MNKQRWLDQLQKDKPLDAVTLGEVMLRLSPPRGERLQRSSALERNVGGAELNVAAGLAQLGLRTAVCTKLPDSPLTSFVVSQAKSFGIETRGVVLDHSPAARIGVYYYESAAAPRKPAIVYDRKFSSINSLTPEELPPRLYTTARLFHTTGITLGLGEGPRATAIEVMKRFKEAGALLSFDVNYRANLWDDQEERRVVEPLLPMLDVLFVSEESLRRMFCRTGELRDIMRSFAGEYGVGCLLSTERRALSPTRYIFTSLVYDREADAFFAGEPYEIEVLDRVGSGDAYVAGALYGLLRYGDAEQAMRYGDAMAAVKCTVEGDLPCTGLREIERLIAAHGSDGIQDEMQR